MVQWDGSKEKTEYAQGVPCFHFNRVLNFHMNIRGTNLMLRITTTNMLFHRDQISTAIVISKNATTSVLVVVDSFPINLVKLCTV